MIPRLTAVILVLANAPAMAQWLTYTESGMPRTKDGRVNLSAPAPRTSDGKPDLSGVWVVEATPREELEKLFGKGIDTFDVPGNAITALSKYFVNILADYQPDLEPLRPEASRLLKERLANGGTDLPVTRCLPGGVPWATFISPFKMIQAPREIVMLHEDNNPPRQIYLDGRPRPRTIELPSWVGFSTGIWQGKTLVVDTVGFNNRAWLDGMGHPRSESLHLTERFTRRDFGHMDIGVTVDDPEMYTTTFSVQVKAVLLPDTDVLEAICAENEKDLTHLATK